MTDQAVKEYLEKGGTISPCPPRWAEGAAEQQFVRSRRKGQKE